MPGQAQLLKRAHACHRAFRLDILRVKGPRPGGVQLAGLELFAACCVLFTQCSHVYMKRTATCYALYSEFTSCHDVSL